jgi:dTMP kinase
LAKVGDVLGGELGGQLIVFEGLDQSGKQTQAEAVYDHVRSRGTACHLLSFPDYRTPIGAELGRALHGERDYAPDVMQLLYVANRYEMRERIQAWLSSGAAVVCDRYVASSIAYGEAQGLDPAWLSDIQRYLPAPDVTVLLDIAPETAVRRKTSGRDRYERDHALLSRVRESYRRQATAPGWLLIDGEQPREAVTAAVLNGIARRLALQ